MLRHRFAVIGKLVLKNKIIFFVFKMKMMYNVSNTNKGRKTLYG